MSAVPAASSSPSPSLSDGRPTAATGVAGAPATAAPLRTRLLGIGALTGVELLGNGMVMFSAAQLMHALGLTAAQFGLAYTLYGVAAIVMLCKHRWMVERLGYRRFAAGSLLVHAAGSLVCACADGPALFMLGRLLQGLGGATFFTAGRLVVNTLPPANRLAGMKAFVTGMFTASALAPLLAALLLETVGWRGLFLAALPWAAVVTRLALRHLPTDITPPEARSQAHWGWLLWLAVGSFGLQYAIQAIGVAPAELPMLALVAGGSAVALLPFAWRQWHHERPLLDYRGLARQRYLVGLCLYFAGYALIGASGLMLPWLLHVAGGVGLGATALVCSASVVASLAMALFHLMYGLRWPRHRVWMLVGLVLVGAGNLAIARTGTEALPSMVCAGLLVGLALPLFMGPVALNTFIELPPEVLSHATQVKNVVRQLGLSSGIALATFSLHVFAGGEGARAGMGGWIADALRGLAAAGGEADGLVAARLVFALLAVGVLPLGVVVAGQRVIR
ncbi:MFS transporter [Derxia gummosa]|uniref:MFS transporter n=1 Tax=Derxia gummosa DSM 723 TaxID=1121388 RepID=A0A8B6XD25_9BURK|nr:MFS transporter [Derxia gummosa]